MPINANDMQMPQIKTIILCLAVFILAISVWFSPVLFKGYLPHDIGSSSIVLARNLAQTGKYAIENDLNVLLSSNLVEKEAHISAQGNKLTAIIYGKIFEITDQLSEEKLVLLSIAINALALVVFTLLVLYLFGFKTAVIFSLIYILLPFNWQFSYAFGAYEFSLLFFSFFFLFYFLGLNRKYSYLCLIPSGFFLGLTCLARETFFLLLPFFFIYLWWKKPKRYLLYILIPFLILLSYFWLPSFLTRGNNYLLIFGNQTPQNLQSSDYGRFGHAFPDPYTYHFDKENYLKNYQNQLADKEINFLDKANPIRALANVGVKQPSFPERIELGTVLFSSHLSKFFSLEEIGGPFIFLLIILGIYSLKQKKRDLSIFALGWMFSVIFLLSFVTLVGRSHLIDFGWMLALLISLGAGLLIEILNQYFGFKQKRAIILSLLIVAVLLYNLLLVNHIGWGKLYDQHQSSLILAYSQEIKKLNIPDQDVIAISEEFELYRLNYLNNKSLVVFRPKTVEGLINKGELGSAFEKFNVKYVLGYSDELSQKITAQTKVINIASSSLELPEIKTSGPQMWLMNLVR